MNTYTLDTVTCKRTPDFNNLLSVLRCEKPSRSTLFEFFLNDGLELYLARQEQKPKTEDEVFALKIKAFQNAGYDYTTVHASDFFFSHNDAHHEKTLSLNEGMVITDRESFHCYKWNNPAGFYNGRIERIEKLLPEGMKFIVCGPGGVLENVIRLTGYDNLCFMLADEPELVQDIFNNVGTRLCDYYRQIVDYPSVGAIISNDDWGFNTQTMLSTDDMRKYVFPWHKKITELVHKAGKPVILHSCGNLSLVQEDIVTDLGYDGKHSYEDNIIPVESAYTQQIGRIATLGGIDLDFVCRKTPQEIYRRSRDIVERTGCEGYALGTGNSVPYYVPYENYLAMIAAVL